MPDNYVSNLINRLSKLSPMPDDDDPALTAERLDNYSDITIEIYNFLKQPEREKDPKLIKALILSFGYGDGNEVYWTTISALEKFPLEVLHPALVEFLEIGERGARMGCAKILGRVRDPRDVPVLCKALSDAETQVRINTLEALTLIGDMAAEEPMKKLLGDADEEVKKYAQVCLDALHDQRWVIQKK